MKRNLIAILSLAVMSLMFTVTGAYAQSYVKANVPFAFNVGAAQLPAGTYEIRALGQSPNVIMIRNPETSASALSIARSEGPRNAESKLVFDRIGSQYFLTEVWKDSGGMIVPTSKHEEELKKELQLTKNPSGDYETIVVALK
jgi:hypothetical protein